MKQKVLKVHPNDNILVAIPDLARNEKTANRYLKVFTIRNQ
jgi:hypothetical protein